MSANKLSVIVKGDPKANTLADCLFCHRVLLTLETKKVPYGLEFIDFDDKPEWLMTASGGKVPVMREGETLMPDSDKIVVYLEEKFPSPSMKPTAPAELGSKLFPAFRQYLFSQTAEEEAEKKAAFDAELKTVNDYLSSHKGPLFGGDHMDATDAAVAPKLYHALTALPHFKKYVMPAEYTAIIKYMEAVKQLPGWKNTDYGTDLIIKGWTRHLAHGH
jgi:glutathione S-transferase